MSPHAQLSFSADTLDDLLREVFDQIRANGVQIKPSKGAATELTGVAIELRNPRARLSVTETRGKLIGCLGELLWYLSGSDSESFIVYYLSFYKSFAEKGVIPGAYGPHLFSPPQEGLPHQFEAVKALLLRKPESRRAVIALYNSNDLVSQPKEAPCTCSLQFLVREGRLHLIAHMRSNDARRGLSTDVFCFTMLQEVLARSLGMDVGTYKHFVGSLHIYDVDMPNVEAFLKEGWQASTTSMPPMPVGDPWPSIRQVLDAEGQLRAGSILTLDGYSALNSYWLDLLRILLLFRLLRKTQPPEHALASSVAAAVVSDAFRPYLDDMLRRVS